MNVRMENWIEEGKHYILHDQYEEFLELIQRVEEDTKTPTVTIAYDTIIRELYLYAITSKKREIVEWMEATLYGSLNEVYQHKLRDTLKYGKYLKLQKWK